MIDATNSEWLDLTTNTFVVQILMCDLSAGDELIMFEGLADDIAFDASTGIVHLRGRDYSSVLVNSTFQASYCNQTASEIISAIASRHGLSTNVTPTPDLIGSYQSADHSQILLNAHSSITSEWDLLTYLAKAEGFELFIDGTTLVFAPLDALPRKRISIDRRNATEIKFRKACQSSGRTDLTVKSWNSWLSQTSRSTNSLSLAPEAASGIGLNDQSEGGITIVRPNLTQQNVEQLAQRYSSAAKEHQIMVEIVMPGDLLLQPRDIVMVDGGVTGFGTDYTVKTVRRQFSPTAGFVQRVQGFATAATSSSGVDAGIS